MDILELPANSTLTINAGSTLYFHTNSGIIVEKDASLNVEGTFEDEMSV